MRWIRFEDKLPTEEEGKQVDILFCEPSWATYHRGLYTHGSEYSLRERLAWYNIEIDKFHQWESMMPTYWMLSPEMPTNTKFQVGERVSHLGNSSYFIKEIEVREHGDPDYIIEDFTDGYKELVEESFLEKIK